MHQALNETTEQTLAYGSFRSPFGDCLIGACQGRVAWLSFHAEGAANEGEIVWPQGPLEHRPEAVEVLARRIFSESSADLRELPLLLIGTEFQRSVWEALQRIPRGETRSYADLAKAMGKPKASRAVGTAIGSNPVSLIVPCHRVIRADGGLGGYRWGTEVKQTILRSEGVSSV